MKKMKYITTAAFALALFAAPGCMKESAPEPSDYRNIFAADPAATDTESVLRREFYNDEGVYLLFNDTLRHELTGYDRFGEEVWFNETVHLGYSLTGASSNVYICDLLEDMASKEWAASFFSEYILSRMGQKLRPYSILPVNTINVWARVFDNLSYMYLWEVQSTPLVQNGMRCTAVAMGEVRHLEGEVLRTKAREILFEMLKYSMSMSREAGLVEFFGYCNSLYNQYKSQNGIPNTPENNENLVILHERGFLTNHATVIRRFPSRDQDTQDYLNALFDKTEQEFEAEFGEYKVVMDKYRILRKTLTDMGVTFN